MKTKSAKAKGRKLQQEVAKEILRQFPELTEHDVKSTTMGESGLDIQLSTKARQAFPFAVECKNCERTQPWKWFEQAEAHSEKEKLYPLVVFKKNRKQPLVMLDFELFMHLIAIRG